jgi:hypothetical protein
MRHRTRHAHATLVKFLSTRLDELGWINPPINFGAKAVTIQDFEAYGSDQGAIQPEPNLVAITLEPNDPDEDQEMGGALIAGMYQFFVDVVGESVPISTALVDDVLLALKNAKIPLLDFTTDAAGVEAPGSSMEFYAVANFVPEASAYIDRRTWRMCSGFVDVFTPDDWDT